MDGMDGAWDGKVWIVGVCGHESGKDAAGASEMWDDEAAIECERGNAFCG